MQKQCLDDNCYNITKQLSKKLEFLYHANRYIEDAKEVESYFIDKGMRSEGTGYGGADFVYIFFSGSPQEKF